MQASPKAILSGKFPLPLPKLKPITMSAASTDSTGLDSKNQSLTF
jgi:hypothetical protein